jgi:hypothetical protein
MTLEASYQHRSASKKFWRIHGGIQHMGQKGQLIFLNPISADSGGAQLNRTLYFVAFGMGRSLAFDKFVFQYGLDLTCAFSFPYQSLAIYEYEDLADSSFLRFESRNFYPAGWGPGIGAFFGLQWNFADRFLLGLEGRFVLSALFLNNETKRTTDSYDRQGNLIGHTVDRENNRTTSIAFPWQVSPPAVVLNYRF